jgi:glycosyltransferase involved in cell wall biosynthesis
MPVYNGEQLVGRAIISILAQDFDDLELTISDNCSTDGTEGICRHFAAIDPRIRYVRQQKNRGSLHNYREVLERSGGEFFFWACHDDWWPPNFASLGVAALERNPAASGAMGSVYYVAADGSERRRHEPPYRLGGHYRLERALSYFAEVKTDELFYSVFRRKVILSAPFVPSTNPWKIVALYALLQGPIIDVLGMGFRKLLMEKTAAEVALNTGIAAYDDTHELATFGGMSRVLTNELGVLATLVFPQFMVTHNWHKFFVRRALRALLRR